MARAGVKEQALKPSFLTPNSWDSALLPFSSVVVVLTVSLHSFVLGKQRPEIKTFKSSHKDSTLLFFFTNAETETQIDSRLKLESEVVIMSFKLSEQGSIFKSWQQTNNQGKSKVICFNCFSNE